MVLLVTFRKWIAELKISVSRVTVEDTQAKPIESPADESDIGF